MKKVLAIIRIENVIPLITNSSSELFVIEAKGKTAEMLAEMVNTSINPYDVVSPKSFEKRFKKESSNYDMDWEVDSILENFPEEDREKLRNQYFTDGGNYFAIMFDRDESYMNKYKVKNALIELGFEFMGSDY